MIFRRRNNPYDLDTCPLARKDVEILAVYNGERARGIVHTPEWSVRMERWQREYDDWLMERARADGVITFSPGARKCSPDL